MDERWTKEMWHLVALLLAFVQLAAYTESLHIPIPSPEKGTIILCSSWASFTSNLDSVEQASFNASSERPLVVTLVVSNFESDPYVPLYLGWITHLFARVDFDPYFMLLEPSVFLAQRREASPRKSHLHCVCVSAMCMCDCCAPYTPVIVRRASAARAG